MISSDFDSRWRHAETINGYFYNILENLCIAKYSFVEICSVDISIESLLKAIWLCKAVLIQNMVLGSSSLLSKIWIKC